MTGTTGIHFPGDLVQVVPHTGKLAQQRRRYRRQSAGTRRLLIEAGLTHPRRQLPAVAPLEQPPVFVFRHPHREHPGSWRGSAGVGQAAGASVAFSGFRGAALNQSRSASGVYTGSICYGGVTLYESASCDRGKMQLQGVQEKMEVTVI